MNEATAIVVSPEELAEEGLAGSVIVQATPAPTLHAPTSHDPADSGAAMIPPGDSEEIPLAVSQILSLTVDSSTGPQTRHKRPALVRATVYKPTSSADVGISVQIADDVVTVASIDPNGLFHGSPLRVGDELLSVNHASCDGKDVAFVMDKMKQARTTVSLVVFNPEGDPNLVATMITKPTPISKVGISFIGTGHNLRVSNIDPRGLFASSLLNTGDRCISIEGVSCSSMDSRSAVALIANARYQVTIVTRTEQEAGVVVASMSSAPRLETMENNRVPCKWTYLIPLIVVIVVFAFIAFGVGRRSSNRSKEDVPNAAGTKTCSKVRPLYCQNCGGCD